MFLRTTIVEIKLYILTLNFAYIFLILGLFAIDNMICMLSYC